MLDEVLPATVVVVAVTDDPPGAELFPEEAEQVTRAVEKRRREFTTGRWCARRALAELREHHSGRVVDGGTVLERTPGGDVYWWTWAGTAANRTLAASYPNLVDSHQRPSDRGLRLRPDVGSRDLASADPSEIVAPLVADAAVSGLKFSVAIPFDLAHRTMSARLGDSRGARKTLTEGRIDLHRSE